MILLGGIVVTFNGLHKKVTIDQNLDVQSSYSDYCVVADQGSGQSGSGSEGGTTQSTSTSGNIGHAQARLMNVLRSGAGRGRIEKPKRKMTR